MNLLVIDTSTEACAVGVSAGDRHFGRFELTPRRHTDCVDVCPVDCFVEGPNFLAINPDECIDCTLCVAECPAEAIFAEDDVPADQQDFIKINADMSKIWPVISSRKEPLPDADSFNGKPNKRSLLDN